MLLKPDLEPLAPSSTTDDRFGDVKTRTDKYPNVMRTTTVAEDPGSKTSSTYDRRTPSTSPKNEHVPLRSEASDPSSPTTNGYNYRRRDFRQDIVYPYFHYRPVCTLRRYNLETTPVNE